MHRRGDEIVVCGTFVHTGAPVVLWTDPGGYDAYRVQPRFKPTDLEKPIDAIGARYGPIRKNLPPETLARVERNGWTLGDLRDNVDLFVLHYDVCAVSRRCFQVLQDERGLSVHFMLDVDGTIYQTLDVKERAWHAGPANDRSIGVEIANIGAYADAAALDRWYRRDDEGKPTLTLPESWGHGGVRTHGFVARPALAEPICGPINGKPYCQYDLTPEQYDSLIRLTAALCRTLPGIRPEFPRDARGTVLTRTMSAEELARFHGVLGHFHLTDLKIDPGPAFDWERLQRGLSVAP
ncbi:MAG: N-acetylmuramoyl-L-alanine amidase [Phycisphaerales bacterium]|nr:N-acetylmuramoyl-L-alanine amidase [Phycisphaerales bacterium]